MKLRADFIKEMGKRNERFVIILDIDNVFSAGRGVPPGASGCRAGTIIRAGLIPGERYLNLILIKRSS